MKFHPPNAGRQILQFSNDVVEEPSLNTGRGAGRDLLIVPYVRGVGDG